MKIVLATRNKNKVGELKVLLENKGIEVITLYEIDPQERLPKMIETGQTLLENVRLKAKMAFQQVGIASIADDTGLEVDALNGAPGVYSARYAGEGCTYQDNVLKLLEEMKDIPMKKRQATFRTVVYFIDGSTELWSEGVIKGFIPTESRGTGGFGYDSVFYLPQVGKTLAELTLEEKNKVSHRAKALKKMIKQVEDLTSPSTSSGQVPSTELALSPSKGSGQVPLSKNSPQDHPDRNPPYSHPSS